MGLELSKKLFKNRKIYVFPDWVSNDACAFNRSMLSPDTNALVENLATWKSFVGTKDYDFRVLDSNEKIQLLHPKQPGSAWYVTDLTKPVGKKATSFTLIAGPNGEFAAIDTSILSYLGIAPGTELEGWHAQHVFVYQHCGTPMAYLMPATGELAQHLTYEFWRRYKG